MADRDPQTTAGANRSLPSGRPIHLVDEMPEIAEHLTPEDRIRAHRELVARAFTVPVGRWQPSTEPEPPGYLGLLVMDGLLTRDVVMHEPLASELVGRGDLLRLADADGEGAPIPFDVAWEVSHRARIAVLDAGFARRASPWPSVAEFVVKAMTTRTHSLAVSMAISRLSRIELRLLVLLWYLADRWGVVRRDGVCVPLKLTHATLGRLIGSRRPSVTVAVGALVEEGRVSRSPERYWILHGDPPETKGWVSGERRGAGAGGSPLARRDSSTVDHHVEA